MSEIKLIRVELEKNYVLAFRLVMILAAWPFLSNIYFAFLTGSIDIRTFTAVRGESLAFYVGVAKNAAFALLFLWLGSFGVMAKTENTDIEES